MVIDIDKFLDEYKQGKVESPDVAKTVKKIDLNFQKDVEDRVYNVEKSSENKDIKFLKKIYDEVKGFDEDLPNKFFGIESMGGQTLSNVGEKYSTDFLSITKSNVAILTKRMNSNLDLLEKEIPQKDFVKILEIYRNLLVDYKHFPSTFLIERVEIGKKLRLCEMNINNMLGEYRDEFVHDVKKKLFILMTELKNSMIKGDISTTENLINQIEYVNNSIPKVLISNFTSEKVLISKVLIKSEEFLVNKYREEFDFRLKDIEKLFEKFHEAYINKNLNKVLLIYNQIIADFKSLPEVFIEKKIEIYKKTNKLFDLVNKLIMNRNVFLFLESYEFGKKIEAFNEYLDHISIMNEINASSLLDIKKKIEELPDKYYDERIELLNKLKSIMIEKKKSNSIFGLNNSGNGNSINNCSGNVRDSKSNSDVNSIDGGDIARGSNGLGFKKVAESNLNKLSQISDNVVPASEVDVKKRDLGIFKRDLKVFEETVDKDEILVLYKKIMSDLNRLGIDKDLRKEMILILNKELHKKRLG